MLNPLWLLFSIVVWLKKTTSLPKLYKYINKLMCLLPLKKAITRSMLKQSKEIRSI